MFNFNKSKILATILLLALTQASQATVFSFEDLNANSSSNSSAGNLSDQLESISSTYDDVLEVFTWETTFNSTSTADGFWLVVNNGPNPKSTNENELAIMYGDLKTNILTTYLYNGANSSNSWNSPGIRLQRDSISTTANSFSLDISTRTINSPSSSFDPDYTGIAFDENIGIWFHLSTSSSFSYNANDFVTAYDYAKQGWYDTANQTTTTSVPEPGVLMLMGLCLAGLGLTRKKKSV